VRLWDNPLPEAKSQESWLRLNYAFHINGQSDSSLKRIIPEPRVPSRGSQARGTRLVIALQKMQPRSQAQCWSTLERNTLHSNDSILKDLKRNDIMQNATRFYQKYLRKCLQNKSMLKNATRMCSIFSKCSQRSRNEHGMLGIKPLTTSTGENLEKSMEMDLKSGKGSRILERLDKADDFSLLRLPKRTWGSVFYILNQNKDFEILDKIRAKIKDLNINYGEGAI
jgi:hypothetical protein